MGPDLIRRVVEELAGELAGGIISRVRQPDERNVVLKVFTRGREKCLLVSAHHAYPRVHLTEQKYPSPPAPKRFCAYLRSRITDARINEISQVPGERIVNIEIEKRSDEGFRRYTLTIELTGKSSNVILLDEAGVVEDALRYFPAESSVRGVEPGVRLEPLPPREGVARESLPEKPEGLSWGEFLDAYYGALLEKDSSVSRRNQLRRLIRQADRRVERKLKNLYDDRRKAEGDLRLRLYGELLSQNPGRVKRGMTGVELIDYTRVPPEAVNVPLDGSLTPRENVERYFKKAKKAKVALGLLEKRIPATEDELDYINSLEYEWENIETEEDMDELTEELVSGGYLKAPSGKTAAEREAGEGEPIRRFTSTEGFTVLCGKSARGNDLIVKKHMKENDLWFHAANIPGSHVLIKAAGKKVTEKTVTEAASIAAYYSKARDTKKAEVLYAEAKYVKKPRGARPGAVTVKEYKTMVVEPRIVIDESRG
ncbi:MAG TPA: NFACT family protein [Thermodesulfobacteriota bacterium]|nr:NFACT family protein [Thermodesulfobacteriota bacterium]